MSNRSKNRKRKTPNKRSATPNLSIATAPKPPAKGFGNLFAIVSTAIGFLGVIFSYPSFVDYFKSPEEKYQEQTFVQGDLKPSKVNAPQPASDSAFETKAAIYSTVNDTLPIIKGILLRQSGTELSEVAVHLGGSLNLIPIAYFYHGIELPIVSKEDTCGKIAFGVKDNRLYVSVGFKDLKNEETIGIIEYNHWKLYKSNMFDFHSDDNRLEVIDKQGNIVFSIEYNRETIFDGVYIDGYLINPNSIAVLRNDRDLNSKSSCNCILKTDSNWKGKAQIQISKILPIFK